MGPARSPWFRSGVAISALPQVLGERPPRSCLGRDARSPHAPAAVLASAAGRRSGEGPVCYRAPRHAASQASLRALGRSGRITRDGDTAIIEYADPIVATNHFKVRAAKLAAMTDNELLQFWNDGIVAGGEHRQSFHFTATEVPIGKAAGRVLRTGRPADAPGHVLRCQILSEAAVPPDVDELFVSSAARTPSQARMRPSRTDSADGR